MSVTVLYQIYNFRSNFIFSFLTLISLLTAAILKGKGRYEPMHSKFFAPLLLLQIIGMLYWWTPISAHDAFYPHHREDFENMARRRELRTTVLLCTVAFLAVLTAVVYAALRNSKDENDIDKRDAKTVQERLTSAANSAANAALQVLNANGNTAEAATTCLTTYAEACGVMSRPPRYAENQAVSNPYQIRCKIGTDVVTLSIDTESIRLKAEYDPSKTGFSTQGPSTNATVSVVLRRAGERNGEDMTD